MIHELRNQIDVHTPLGYAKAIAWGGGWKTKTFPKSKSAVDIMNENVVDYLQWSNGREGVDKD